MNQNCSLGGLLKDFEPKIYAKTGVKFGKDKFLFGVDSFYNILGWRPSQFMAKFNSTRAM